MDTAWESHFDNLTVTAHCCGASISLSDLRYDGPAGFGPVRAGGPEPECLRSAGEPARAAANHARLRAAHDLGSSIVDRDARRLKASAFSVTHEEIIHSGTAGLGHERTPLARENCREIVERCHNLLDGRVGVIEAARSLTALAFRVRAEEDTDFLLFRVIGSESDALPVGPERAHWSAGALEREDARIAGFEDSWREQAMLSARNLADRYACRETSS
jgi:hypothetical protein